MPQRPSALLLLLLLPLLLPPSLAVLPPRPPLPPSPEEAAFLFPLHHRRLFASSLEVHFRAQVPPGRQPSLPLLRVEKCLPEAPAGPLPTRPGLRFRRLELP